MHIGGGLRRRGSRVRAVHLHQARCNELASTPLRIDQHPDWFRLLFTELDRRGTSYLQIEAAHHQYDPDETEKGFSLLFNRMSPSAHLRGHGQGIFYTLNYLAHLEREGLRVVNNRAAFTIETSKALQLSLLRSLGS
jgi:hypothetical protein